MISCCFGSQVFPVSPDPACHSVISFFLSHFCLLGSWSVCFWFNKSMLQATTYRCDASQVKLNQSFSFLPELLWALKILSLPLRHNSTIYIANHSLQAEEKYIIKSSEIWLCFLWFALSLHHLHRCSDKANCKKFFNSMFLSSAEASDTGLST
jgi:hypothetical protein